MRRGGIVGAGLALLALLYWLWSGRGRSEGAKGGVIGDGGVVGAGVEVMPAGAPGARAVVTAIRGRVRVAAGALPPAQVCVSPAGLEQDWDGRGWFSPLALLARCVATTEDGFYQMEGLVPGRYVVSAAAEGYLVVRHQETPNQPWISLQLGQVREGLDFLLRIRGIAVQGVVRDVAGGTISGALVMDDSGARVLTGEDGGFTLWALAQSTIIVGAFASGYTLDSAFARPPQGPLTLWLTPESVLRGRVVREETGAAVPGIGVHLSNHEEMADAETAADGSFELRGLDPGRYKPYVRGDGWCGNVEPSVALGLGETSDPVLLKVRACPVVTAKVIVRPAGEPCSSAQIELLDVAGDVQRRALADGGGVAKLCGLEPGVYQARIKCPGYIQREPVSWVLSEAMATDVVWEVEAGRTLRGVIRDHRGNGVPRANVEITGAWGYTGADADDLGAFVATVQPGPAKLTPYSRQFRNGVAIELEIPESRDPAPVVLEFPASSTGVVSGRVRARVGQLPPGLTVVVRARDSFAAHSGRLDADGRYILSGLDRGSYEIFIQRYGGVRERSESEELAPAVVVDLGAQERAEADFVLDVPGLVALSGRVEQADKTAEPDALVTVASPLSRGERQRILSDEQGRFSVQVPGGTRYTVDVTTRDGSVLQQKDVEPGAPLTLRFPATREVCGKVEADAPVTESFTIGVEGGVSERFAAGTQRWCLDRVPVGAHAFTARSPSFGAAKANVEVPARGAVPEVVLRFGGRTSLRGRVLDGVGQPRAAFKVWVLDATGRLVGGNLYTDDSGEFTLAGAPAGELTVIPIAAGPFPGREKLLALGTKVQIGAERPSDPVVLIVP